MWKPKESQPTPEPDTLPKSEPKAGKEPAPKTKQSEPTPKAKQSQAVAKAKQFETTPATAKQPGPPAQPKNTPPASDKQTESPKVEPAQPHHPVTQPTPSPPKQRMQPETIPQPRIATAHAPSTPHSLPAEQVPIPQLGQAKHAAEEAKASQEETRLFTWGMMSEARPGELRKKGKNKIGQEFLGGESARVFGSGSAFGT